MPVSATPIPRPQVLVIDDSRVIRKAIENILRKEFDLLEAADGEAGWQTLLADHDFKVVLSDIDMPQLDGYGLICRIRAHAEERIRDLPVIVVTGADDARTRERAFACGATDFIIKPIDRAQLLSHTRAHAHLDEPNPVLEQTQRALAEQSTTDALTRLASRRYLLQRGAQDIAHALRHGHELSVIRIGIDNLRDFYDRHGDEGFQKLLPWLADRFRDTARTEDTVARLQGGDFAILAPATGHLDAEALCERLRSAVASAPFSYNGDTIPITLSLGLATLGRESHDTIEALITAAEQRLTLAKASGGNRLGPNYQEETTPPDETTIEQPDMETALAILARGDGGQLLPYLPELLERLLPLLEYGNRQLDLDLKFAIELLKEQLRELK